MKVPDTKIIALISSFILLIILHIISENSIPLLSSILFFIMAFWTAFLWFNYVSSIKHLPWIETWNLVFFVMYCISIFLGPQLNDFNLLMLISFIGFSAFNFGFFYFKSKDKKFKYNKKLSDNFLVIGMIASFLIHLLSFGFVFFQFRVFFDLFFRIFFFVLFYRLLTKKLKGWHKWTVIAFGIFYLFTLFGFYIAALLFFIYTIVIIYCYAKSKNPTLFFFLLLVFLLVMQPAKNSVRDELEWGIDSKIQIAKLYFTESYNYWTHQLSYDDSYQEILWNSAFSRLGYVYELEEIIQRVPNSVNYYYGKFYLRSFVFTLIPRFVWPSKPDFHESIRQYMVDIHDYSTLEETGVHINPGFIGSLFINFGVLGVLIGSFIFGSIMGFMNKELNYGETNIYYKLCAFLILTPEVLDPRSYLTNKVYFLAAMLLLIYYFGKK